MARSTRPLKKSLLATAIVLAVVFTPAHVTEAAAVTARWFSPSVHNGKSFPVLLPADGKWLNWRDTYGAPRMRLEPDGVWRQVGVHQGIDIFAEQGTPVVAIAPGRVENAGWTFYSGWRVGVRGDDGRYYFYAHLLRDLAPGIIQGARVRAGTRLGSLGSSGYGPEGTFDEFPAHLHFGLQTGDGWINPQAMLADLYDLTVKRIRELKGGLVQTHKARRLLLARAHSPAGDTDASLVRRAQDLRTEAARIEDQLAVVESK